ncbi:MAG: TraR/DksA C4-type zinc finger protein [Alphaproteobacteria bacterium]|jgi:DnaK suppressor protein|nr:TraR/DksA C4-type zinc finger protein [Alphaproteobacteria bacterium]
MTAGDKNRDLAAMPERVSERLLARQAELRALSDNAKDARKPVELDQSKVGRLSRMDAIQDQAMAQESERRRLGELQRIEAALERIKSGDYGFCVSCDEDIAPARLDLDPAVATCINCASRGTTGKR